VSTSDLIDRPLHEFVTTQDSLLCDEHVRKASESGETEVFELKLQRQDGTTADTRWNCFWSVTERSLFCVVQDITEQKQIESLKQDFVDMISHDLRSPLTSMYGSMTLITSGATGPAAAEVILEAERAGRNIEILINFVNDLLDFQKLESGKVELDLQENDLRQAITEAAEMVRGLAEDRRVTLALPSESKIVHCDRQKIVQAVLNLISNAIKFSPAESTVSVTLCDHPELLEINVIDSGPGVPESYRTRIFEAFEQVDSEPRAKEGTGLGLAICKLIMVAHGGAIGVSPADNNDDGQSAGSRFWLHLPKEIKPAGAAVPAGQPAESKA
jgi:signal transduction histidine kinase